MVEAAISNQLPQYDDLSAGQRRVRAIAVELLAREGTDFLKEEECPVYNELIDRVSRDKVVTGDDYTGRKIADCNLSYSYQEYLGRVTNPMKIIKDSISGPPLERLRFDRMIIEGRTYDKHNNPDQYVYRGGAGSPSTTARAIFSFVAGYPMFWNESDQVRARYYELSGTLEVVSNGNHRTLANKLVGSKMFPLKYIKCYREPCFDKELDVRLQQLETFLPPETSIKLIGEQPPPKQIANMVSYCTNQPDFVQLITPYLHRYGVHYPEGVPIEELINLREAHRLFTLVEQRSALHKYLIHWQKTRAYRTSNIAIQQLTQWIDKYHRRTKKSYQ